MNLVFTSKKTSFINPKKIIKKEINFDLEKSKKTVNEKINTDLEKPKEIVSEETNYDLEKKITLPNILNHIKRGKKGGCSACGH